MKSIPVDYLEDVPGSKVLTKFVEDRIGSGYIVIDVSTVWARAWLKHLHKFNVQFYKVIGEETIRAHYESPQFDFYGSGLALINFNGTKMVIFKLFINPDSHYWVFVDQKKRNSVKKLVSILLHLEREAKELHIWNVKDVPLEKLDTLNFVLPAFVENIFSREVYPQMEDGEIFNHVLLYSYPGVGKTAFCRYLAKKYPDWQTVMVFPSAMEKPHQILHAFDYASYRAPAILIFEDIDTWAQSRFLEQSMKEDFSPFLGALLNAIDGIETHEKLLVVSTTNNPECLDPGIVRPGRFGIQVEFRYSEEELIRICNNYLGDERGIDFYRKVIKNTPAHLRTLMKTMMAYAKLNDLTITQDLLVETDKELKKETKLPKLEDLFTSMSMPDSDEAIEVR